MMDCGTRQEQMSMMLDGELPLAAQSELFGHLADCEQCRSFFDAIVRIRDAGAGDVPEYPSSIDEELFARLPNIHKPVLKYEGVRRRATPATIMIAAGIALLLFAAGFFGGRLSSGEPRYPWQTAASFPAERPTTVIMVYGVPPVDVIGTLPAGRKVIAY